jgi:hypothetical protein
LRLRLSSAHVGSGGRPDAAQSGSDVLVVDDQPFGEARDRRLSISGSLEQACQRTRELL